MTTTNNSVWEFMGYNSNSIYITSADPTITFGDTTGRIYKASDGTMYKIESGGDYIISNNQVQKRIGPRLYFKYVKSKFTKNELKELKHRMSVLSKLLLDAHDLGQVAMHEALSKQLVVAIEQQELAIRGYTTYIERKHIERFMHLVSDNNIHANKIIYFKELREFPRPIPKKIQKHIKEVQDKNIFDELWILYLDYTTTSKDVVSNKEKIREKDPILFGIKKTSQADNLFFIDEWDDDVCDLNLDEIVRKIKVNPSEVPEINSDFISNLRKSIKRKEDRLRDTKSSNYKAKMAEEDSDS